MASKTILNIFNSTSDKNSIIKLKKKDFDLVKKYLKELLLIFDNYEEFPEESQVQNQDEVPSGFVISEVNVVQLKSEPEFFNEDEIVSYEPKSQINKSESEDDESTSISYSNLSSTSVRQQPSKRRRVLSKSSSSPTINSSHKKSTKKPQQSNNKIKCEKCDEFVPKTGWRNHVYEHKYKDLGRVFTCTICDYASYIKRGIKSHVQNFHKTTVELNDLKPVVLEANNQILITLKHKENLRQLRVREKKVECPVCAETISVNYIQHFNDHEIENSSDGFRCSLCVFNAPSQYYLMNHMKSAHGILMEKKKLSKFE